MDALPGTVTISNQTATARSKQIRWTGSVEFVHPVIAGEYRLLIRRYEYLSANYTSNEPTVPQGRPRLFHPNRLIYAETVEVDSALISSPTPNAGTTLED